MNTKDILKLFIPPIISILKDKIRKRPHLIESPLPQLKTKTDKIILIGNGPSLNMSVDKYLNEILKYDRLATNFFASSELFEMIKPTFYLFADPAFFLIPDNQKASMEVLFHNIITKTAWPMIILIPNDARQAPLVKEITKNSNITINYYFTGYQDIGKISKYEAWNRNYIIPHYQNVLNVGVYLALYWEYKETYLIGADTSSLEDIRIDQITNELFSVDSHFYNNSNVYNDKKLFDKTRGRIRSDWKLHEYIYAFGRMFEDYYELRKYADYKGLKVYNACEYSWINCFERKKIN